MNLKEEELKNLILAKIIKIIDKWEQPCGKITIQFICDPKYKPTIKLKYVFRNWHLNELNIGNNEQMLKILQLNLHYNEFTLIDEKHKTTEVECHGHGDFWAKEYHELIFYRIPEKQ